MLNLNLLACMFILSFLSVLTCPFLILQIVSAFIKSKTPPLSSFQDEAHDDTLYHSKCVFFLLSPFLSIAYHISFSSSLFKSSATFI